MTAHCELCALRKSGHTDQADTLEAIRAQRLTLATLKGHADALGEITAQIHDCHECTKRLAGIYLVTYTTLAKQAYGGDTEAAIGAHELALMLHLDALKPHSP